MAEARAVNTQSPEEQKEEEEAGSAGEFQPLRLSQVSAELREALLAAPIGATGMRSVRAIGPQNQRYTAGLYGENVYLLELPWPNPRNECRSLQVEPRGVQWQAYSVGTRGV